MSLLGYIGGKMLWDNLKKRESQEQTHQITPLALLMQGIATAIDALSVGFTIADYDRITALASAAIIAVVTFTVCMTGIAVGKKAGIHLADKAGILGGVILILIGLEIFVTSWL